MFKEAKNVNIGKISRTPPSKILVDSSGFSSGSLPPSSGGSGGGGSGSRGGTLQNLKVGLEQGQALLFTMPTKVPSVNLPKLIYTTASGSSNLLAGGAIVKDILEPKYKEKVIYLPSEGKYDVGYKAIVLAPLEPKVGTKGPDVITVTDNRTDTRTIDIPIETPIVETKPIEITIPIQEIKPIQKIEIGQIQRPALSTDFPYPLSILSPPRFQGIKGIQPIIPKIPMLKLEFAIEDKGPRRKVPKKKKPTGYEVFIKKQKKYLRVSPERVSLPKEEAEALGMRAALKGAQATFKIVPSVKPIISIGQKVSPETRVLFRPGRKAGEFIQKERLRILTPGEKKEISFKGIQVRKARKSAGILRRPKKRSSNKSKSRGRRFI